MTETGGIGCLGEKSLHAALKQIYGAKGDLEVRVDRYVADVKTPYGLVEIQTGSFAKIRTKLTRLLESHRVRVVYPIPEEKVLVTLDDKGEVLSRRKSPKRGKPADVGRELAAIRDLLGHPRFELEILLTREEEIRIRDGKGSWRRRGVSRADRKLVAIVKSVVCQHPLDYLTLLTPEGGPPLGPEPFTNRELAGHLKVHPVYASGLTRSLLAIGVLHFRGRRGKAYLFSPEPEKPTPR